MSKPADSFSYHLVDSVEVVRFPPTSAAATDRSPTENEDAQSIAAIMKRQRELESRVQVIEQMLQKK